MWVNYKMVGYTIDKAYKIDNKGIISYQARAVKPRNPEQWLESDATCKSVKKIANPEQPSLQKPATGKQKAQKQPMPTTTPKENNEPKK